MAAGTPIQEKSGCTSFGCSEPGHTELGGTAFCVGHFLTVCQTRLENYQELQQNRSLSEIGAASVHRFVRECTREADRLEGLNGEIQYHHRERLLDIMLLATELGRRIRRSVRKAAHIPLQLSLEMPGHPWTVDAETLLVSQHGALVELPRSLPVHHPLRVVRLDTFSQAQAHVAWYQRKQNGHIELGIEFVDCENFWQIDWPEE